MKNQMRQTVVLFIVALILLGLYFLFTRVIEFKEDPEQIVSEYSLGATDYLPVETDDVSKNE